MIPNHWYAILESSEVKPGKPVGVTRLGEKLVLWRDAKGQVTCMADLCPHRGVALSIGKLMGDCVECPFHGFRFDPSGRCTLIPAYVGNRVILNQDKRPVITERPKRTALHIGEKMIPSDGPIVEYRRRRDELIGITKEAV
jgi:phenylpropionate dioxygenase-like ring-hydroxylating dioxygenase large terminal subunit